MILKKKYSLKIWTELERVVITVLILPVDSAHTVRPPPLPHLVHLTRRSYCLRSLSNDNPDHGRLW